jgi:hypothetical protein
VLITPTVLGIIKTSLARSTLPLPYYMNHVLVMEITEMMLNGDTSFE